jgi:hypothetical protein
MTRRRRYSPVNARRARSAAAALKAFVEACPTDDDDAINDLMINLLHLARRKHGVEFDAEALVDHVLKHFVEEQTEGW